MSLRSKVNKMAWGIQNMSEVEINTPLYPNDDTNSFMNGGLHPPPFLGLGTGILEGYWVAFVFHSDVYKEFESNHFIILT